MKKAYNFIISGQPLPCPRPRVSSRGVYYPKVYQDYFVSVRDILSWQFFEKEYTPIIKDYCLEVKFYRKGKKRSDWDNLGKCISDALEQAGVIKNDNLFTDVRIKINYDSENPRTEIRIQEPQRTQ